MNPASTMAMNHAAMNTKIQRSIACARGVPVSKSRRSAAPSGVLATVAIALSPQLPVTRPETVSPSEPWLKLMRWAKLGEQQKQEADVRQLVAILAVAALAGCDFRETAKTGPEANKAAPAAAADEPALVRAAADTTLQWGPCPAPFPQGCELTVLHGDPAKPNADVMLRMPGGYVIPAHRHTSPERMILVGGKLNVKYAGSARGGAAARQLRLWPGRQAPPRDLLARRAVHPVRGVRRAGRCRGGGGRRRVTAFDAGVIDAKYRELGYQKGWNFLACREERLRDAEVAIVGLNPGGGGDGDDYAYTGVWSCTNNSYCNDPSRLRDQVREWQFVILAVERRR